MEVRAQVNPRGAESEFHFRGKLFYAARMKRLLLAVLSAALLGLGGCAMPDAETGRNKSPPVVLTFAPTPKKAVATVRIGDEVRFVLPAERGPDFLWQIVSNDPRCLRQFGRTQYKAGAAGAGGTTTVAFIAQRPSRSIVRFAYVPATNSKETELVDAYEVVVTVKP